MEDVDQGFETPRGIHDDQVWSMCTRKTDGEGIDKGAVSKMQDGGDAG